MALWLCALVSCFLLFDCFSKHELGTIVDRWEPSKSLAEQSPAA